MSRIQRTGFGEVAGFDRLAQSPLHQRVAVFHLVQDTERVCGENCEQQQPQKENQKKSEEKMVINQTRT